jgi:hypothetical protein
VGERVAPERLECPFIDLCSAQVTQQQYESYCMELMTTPHQPNYLVCQSYQRLMNSPRVWKKRMEGSLDDTGYGSTRTRGGHGV